MTADVGNMLKAISEPTRFKIVQLLLERHHCARSISLTLGISEPAVSQHMSVLRDAGVVISYRHGYHIHYVLEEDAFATIVSTMQGWIEKMRTVENCHDSNPCQFKMDDGSSGCIYRS